MLSCPIVRESEILRGIKGWFANKCLTFRNFSNLKTKTKNKINFKPFILLFNIFSNKVNLFGTLFIRFHFSYINCLGNWWKCDGDDASNMYQTITLLHFNARRSFLAYILWVNITFVSLPKKSKIVWIKWVRWWCWIKVPFLKIQIW